MDSFNQLRNQAAAIAQNSHDHQVAELARIIERLCDTCTELERQVKAAQNDANRAKRAVKTT